MLNFDILRYIVQLKDEKDYLFKNRPKFSKIVNFTGVFDHKIGLKSLYISTFSDLNKRSFAFIPPLPEYPPIPPSDRITL